MSIFINKAGEMVAHVRQLQGNRFVWATAPVVMPPPPRIERTPEELAARERERAAQAEYETALDAKFDADAAVREARYQVEGSLFNRGALGALTALLARWGARSIEELERAAMFAGYRVVTADEELRAAKKVVYRFDKQRADAERRKVEQRIAANDAKREEERRRAGLPPRKEGERFTISADAITAIMRR